MPWTSWVSHFELIFHSKAHWDSKDESLITYIFVFVFGFLLRQTDIPANGEQTPYSVPSASKRKGDDSRFESPSSDSALSQRTAGPGSVMIASDPMEVASLSIESAVVVPSGMLASKRKRDDSRSESPASSIEQASSMTSSFGADNKIFTSTEF